MTTADDADTMYAPTGLAPEIELAWSSETDVVPPPQRRSWRSVTSLVAGAVMLAAAALAAAVVITTHHHWGAVSTVVEHAQVPPQALKTTARPSYDVPNVAHLAPDQRMLNAMAIAGLHGDTPGAAPELGHAICDDLDAGTLPGDETQLVSQSPLHDGSHVRPEQAEAEVRAAISAYCPQHGGN
jgi:serine/threonine-protein kinase